MNNKKFSHGCLYDGDYNAIFFPCGYVINTPENYINIFKSVASEVDKNNLEMFFDYSESDVIYKDALLHEICHYLQFSTTSMGLLHLLLSLASAEITIGSTHAFCTGKERKPSSVLDFLKPSRKSISREECNNFAKAVDNIWQGKLDLRPIHKQLEDIRRIVGMVINPSSPEGKTLLQVINSLDLSKESPHSGGILALPPIQLDDLPLFSLEREDVLKVDSDFIYSTNMPDCSVVTMIDLIEGHARLIEEYVTLVGQTHKWSAHPWATDHEYRASKQLGKYGRTRNILNQSLKKQNVMRELLKLTKRGKSFDLTVPEIMNSYLHILELQLLVHDIALMIPLSTGSTNRIPWIAFSPLERFNIARHTMEDWSNREWGNLPVGVLRECKHWYQIADLITNRIGGPTYSETVSQLATASKGSLGKRLPHLSHTQKYRKILGIAYLGILDVLKAGMYNGPGPFFAGERNFLQTNWLLDPRSIFQWQTWIWGVGGGLYLEGKEQLARNIGMMCSKIGRTAEEAAFRTGLLIGIKEE